MKNKGENAISPCRNPETVFCRLFARFLFEIRASIGAWEPSGSSPICWITIQLQTMVTGPTELVSASISKFFKLNTVA